jgi:hypothetical protein
MGTALHWDGAAWTREAPGFAGTIYAVQALASGEVWAVGESGTVLHRVGTNWLRSATGSQLALYGIWTGGTVAWAISDNELIFRSP